MSRRQQFRRPHHHLRPLRQNATRLVKSRKDAQGPANDSRPRPPDLHRVPGGSHRHRTWRGLSAYEHAYPGGSDPGRPQTNRQSRGLLQPNARRQVLRRLASGSARPAPRTDRKPPGSPDGQSSSGFSSRNRRGLRQTRFFRCSRKTTTSARRQYRAYRERCSTPT